MYVDTHCHLDDKRYEDVGSVVNDFENAGVGIAINMGCDVPSSVAGQNFSKKHQSIYFGCGFHPSEISKFSHDDLDTLRELANDEKCVCVGEIGLDYHWEGFDKDEQIQAFVCQLELAYSLKLPVSIHSRDATQDMLSILKGNKSLLTYGAVMHCYSGSTESARTLMNLGVLLGFGGTVTFKNAVNLKEVAKFVPTDFCLTETDSPYLSPEPLRGSTNTPKNVSLVAQYLAYLKGVPLDKFCEQIVCNTKRIFTKIK